MRTTLNIDDPLLKELKRLQAQQGKSLGRLVSDLLARALSSAAARPAQTRMEWIAKPMNVRMDLSDKEAVWRALDEPSSRANRS